jgi:hypothetical protein
MFLVAIAIFMLSEEALLAEQGTYSSFLRGHSRAVLILHCRELSGHGSIAAELRQSI